MSDFDDDDDDDDSNNSNLESEVNSNDEEVESVDEEAEDDESVAENNNSFQILSDSTTCVENVGAVPSQLKVWDQLMAARIKMQQVMKLANCLSIQKCNTSPNKDIAKRAMLSHKRAQKMQSHLESLIKSLLSSMDCDKNGQFDLNSEDSIWEPVLEQWWNKTCLPQPGKKSNSKSNFSQLEESPVKYAKRLMADKSPHIRRTQLKRLDYRAVLGSDSSKSLVTEEYDPKIFDDNDFYQVLVRDVISKKLAGSNDPSAMARTLLSGEKLTADILHSKKQAVDRRASKGRKIRYNVMPKLVNYMGPNNKISWTDQQRDELFKSLFQQI